jgi:hypothetical protein
VIDRPEHGASDLLFPLRGQHHRRLAAAVAFGIWLVSPGAQGSLVAAS